MPTKDLTVESLHAEYAARIADAIGLDMASYEPTAEGLARLLLDASDNFGSLDQTGDWLADAAANLDAIARLGGDDSKTQELLKRIDSALYDAIEEMEG